MFTRALFILCLASLTGCASGSLQKTSDAVITVISRVNNTAIADLQQAQAVAKAATPVDADGVACSAAAIVVNGQINAVLAAAKGPNTGVFTLAELASLFQPGSAQYNQVKQTLTSGCAAKVQDVLGAAALLQGGVIGVLATSSAILPLAAAGT